MKFRKKLLSNLQAWLFMLPAIALLATFVFGPLFTSFGYSLMRFENFLPTEFVGFKNFKTAFSLQMFWNSLQLTFKWVVMNMLFPTFCGLFLALLMEFYTKKQVFTGLTRTILFMPMMMSLVAAGVLWAMVFDPSIGIIAGLFKMLNITTKFNAFGNASTSLYFAFIPIIWKDSGFSMVVFSAAAQGVSKDMIEASIVEGASKMQRIRFVMVPSMMSTLVTVLLINMISGFKAFDMLFALTRGGPGAATNVMAVYAYEQAFTSYLFDYASAVMTLQLGCVIIFILIFNLLMKPIKKKYST